MHLRVKIVVVVFFKHSFGEGEFGPRLSIRLINLKQYTLQYPCLPNI